MLGLELAALLARAVQRHQHVGRLEVAVEDVLRVQEGRAAHEVLHQRVQHERGLGRVWGVQPLPKGLGLPVEGKEAQLQGEETAPTFSTLVGCLGRLQCATTLRITPSDVYKYLYIYIHIRGI